MSDTLDIEWLRPAFSWTPTPNGAPIIFQYLDIDNHETQMRPGFIRFSNGIVPVVRLYGVTEDGESVLCHVHGYHPYFYVYTQQKPDTSKLLHFRRMLDQRVKTNFRLSSVEEVVLEVDYMTSKSSHGASGDELHHFLKITVATHRAIQPVKEIFAKGGLEPMGVYFEGANHQGGFHIFEANIDHNIRFLCDLNIQGCSWIELPINKYQIRDKDRTSHCQLECDINFNDLIAHSPKGRWANTAPFRILSYDIETTVDFGMPRPEKQPVIQISSVVIKRGCERPFITCIFTLRSCAPINGAVIKSYNSESDMLMAWSKFVIGIDPDIITGYNINSFDTRYLLRRAEVLGLTKFPYLGRIAAVQTKRTPKGSTSPYSIQGRIQLDLIQVVRRNHRDGNLKKCSLEEVARHYLKKGKSDVHYTQITGLFNGTAEDRRKLAVYCIKDSELVLELIAKLGCVDHHLDLAEATGLPLNYLLYPSVQEIRTSTTVANLLRTARERNQLLADSPTRS